nr:MULTISPECIES: hypothetical protein [Pseudomonas]
MIEAGEPLILEALEAQRAYHAAQKNGAPNEELERFRLLAESLCQAVLDFQLLASGQPPSTIH